ncbi:hypothetical protein EV424DRAFT_1327742, partial [Suillus variegatus]
KILSLTGDNESSNDMLTTELAKHMDSFSGSLSRTHCFLHIVNLVAKSLPTYGCSCPQYICL